MFKKVNNFDFSTGTNLTDNEIKSMVSKVRQEMEEDIYLPFFSVQEGRVLVIGIRDPSDEIDFDKFGSYEIFICENGYRTEYYSPQH